MKTVDRIVHGVSRVANILGVSLLFGIMVLVSLNVVLRYLFKAPVAGTFELVELMLVVAVFCGFAYTTRTRGHITVDLIVDALPARLRTAIDLTTTALSLLVFGFMFYALWLSATGPGAGLIQSDMLAVPLQPFKIFVAIAIGLVCIELLLQVLQFLRALSGGQGPAA